MISFDQIYAICVCVPFLSSPLYHCFDQIGNKYEILITLANIFNAMVWISTSQLTYHSHDSHIHDFWGPFYKHGLILIPLPAWISNHMPVKCGMKSLI